MKQSPLFQISYKGFQIFRNKKNHSFKPYPYAYCFRCLGTLMKSSSVYLDGDALPAQRRNEKEREKVEKKRIRVAVAMSGGVDSSVVAYLLKEEAKRKIEYDIDIMGVHMQNWDASDENGRDKCDRVEEDFKDVQRICESLKIPLYTCNFVKPYWNNVFIPFLDSYRLGLTPNPDVLCNREIKFKVLLDYIQQQLNADFLATGHYAKLVRHKSRRTEKRREGTALGKDKNNFDFHDVMDLDLKSDESDLDVHLLRGVDPSKDQSYFLSHVPKEQLKHVIFPLGDYTKAEVKQIAKDANLHTFNKKESMGICFIGKRKFEDFLPTYLEQEKGNFVCVDLLTAEEEGRIKDDYQIAHRILGKHKGISLYTIGQGAKISGLPEKYYVCGKNMTKNEIYVCKGTYHEALYVDSIFVDSKQFNWIDKLPIPSLSSGSRDHMDSISIEQKENVDAVDEDMEMGGIDEIYDYELQYQIRYRQTPGICKVRRVKSKNIEEDKDRDRSCSTWNDSIWEIIFDTPQRGVAKEQTLALYDGNRCLGGGIIYGVGKSYFERNKSLPPYFQDWSM